ncbi:MAG TPA: hypothetical protein ENH00_05240 [Actinobacteria bacterium]|nr:hypothetical protein [Actinomycetota bacterium]
MLHGHSFAVRSGVPSRYQAASDAEPDDAGFIPLAGRFRFARVVYLRLGEPAAVEGVATALEWLDGHVLPDGMVL